MWCKKCNIETNDSVCSICGTATVEDVPIEIFGCDNCCIPIINSSTAADKGTCPYCKGKTRYLASDLRPVFPEERLLLAILLGKKPDAYMMRSVWAVGSKYYIDGKSLTIPIRIYSKIVVNYSEMVYTVDNREVSAV